ncbi:alkaline phosphatase family protein [bacterium]|nr:alkaline phosphatase family protein [bacterium]
MLRKIIVSTIILLVILPSLLYPQETNRIRNVILIGWDGAQRNHIKECLERDELPNLKKLISEGTIVAIDILRTTDTKAGWAQILTGYEPEKTGVYSNSRYQPIPKGYTIFERLEEHFGKDNFYTVAIISKKNNLGISPPKKIPLKKVLKKNKLVNIPQRNIIEENGVKYVLDKGEPYYYTKDSLDLFVNGLGEDRNVGTKALEALEKYKDKPFFFFIHFGEIDAKGHKFGENSKEYNSAIISADYWLGKIIEKLKELGLYEDTLIYVTADHGFDEGEKTHSSAPYVFLATNDRGVMRRGRREDITPTILERFGIDTTKLSPPLDGHSLLRPYIEPIW